MSERGNHHTVRNTQVCACARWSAVVSLPSFQAILVASIKAGSEATLAALVALLSLQAIYVATIAAGSDATLAAVTLSIHALLP